MKHSAKNLFRFNEDYERDKKKINLNMLSRSIKVPLQIAIQRDLRR